MAGGIYDHLLIIGTFCSFIQGMANAWLLHNLLIPTLLEILQKSSRKNYASAGILGRELLPSGPGFTRPGMSDSASPRSLHVKVKIAAILQKNTCTSSICF